MNGAVSQISPAGAFQEVLYTNDGNDDLGPFNGGLVEDSNGNFYGTTDVVAFRLTPAGVLTGLHSFVGSGGVVRGQLVLGEDGNLYGTTASITDASDGTVFELTPTGELTTLHNFSGGDGDSPAGALVRAGSGKFFGTTAAGGANGDGTIFELTVDNQPTFFAGQTPLANSVYYLTFTNGNLFGYYSFLVDQHYIFHFDLGYEYVFDTNDGNSGVYFYDFASSDSFYTSPTFPFPYLYDFDLQSVLYYYPDTGNAGHYTSNPRVFYDFATRQIIGR